MADIEMAVWWSLDKKYHRAQVPEVDDSDPGLWYADPSEKWGDSAGTMLNAYDRGKFWEFEMWCGDLCGTVYVHKDERDAFCLMELPNLIAKVTQIKAAEDTSYQLKALVTIAAAFVRHGHGEHVISEDGQMNIEQRQRFRARQRDADERKRLAEKAQP